MPTRYCPCSPSSHAAPNPRATHGSSRTVILAELAVDRDPWRSAIFARRVVKVDPDDDGAWAVLGLAQTLLGNYRYAVASYRRAIALAPQNPWYAHNLGHLLDVALGRPADAVGLLAEAHKREPKEAEIASSYAHAFARAGKLAQAKKVLSASSPRAATAEQMILWRWLEQGAPANKARPRDRAHLRPGRSPRTRPRRADTRATLATAGRLYSLAGWPSILHRWAHAPCYPSSFWPS